MAKKILVVDDEPEVARLVSGRLKSNGYEVDTAYDAMQAVMKAHKFSPDLIILDINMPAGGGFTVFKNLKESTDTMIIPVIFLTAVSDDITRAKVIAMGAEDFVAKPFDAEDLMKRIRRVLGETPPEEEKKEV